MINNLAFIDDRDQRVKDALETWAEYMKSNDSDLGYPHKSAGFKAGGGTWGSCFEDMEIKYDNALAHAVEAILEGMGNSQRIAIYHFHLGAVWRSNRTILEDDYAAALVAMEVGLRRRGMI